MGCRALFALSIAALTGFSCGSGMPRADSDIIFPDVTTGDVDGEVSDDDADRAAIEEGIRTLMREHLLFTNGAGIAVGIEDRRVAWRASLAEGVEDVKSKKPLAADSLFRVASISKMFIAAAVLRLTEEQKIDLDDTLDRWYPDYPEADRITVRMLLNHTSGISDYVQPGESEEIIAASADMPRYFEPGEGWAYSNTNYIFLGRIIEKVSGKTLGDHLQSAVFERAGITHTTLEKEDGINGTLATGHLFANDKLEPYLGENPAWADGGIVSSVSDLISFMTRLFEGWLVSTLSLDEMLTFVSTGGEKMYGLGVLWYGDPTVGEGYGHNGSLTNFNGELVYFPLVKMAIAVQANYPVVSDTDYLRREVVRLAVNAISPPVADECTLPSFLYQNSESGSLYETVRFKGVVNDIESENPENGSGYYFFSKGTGLDNLFCVEYVFLSEDGNGDFLYFLEECPEVERYYTRIVKTKRFEFALPLTDLRPLAGKQQTSVTPSATDYARLEYWYDLVANRVTKRCLTAVPDAKRAVEVSICPQRNTSFTAKEEVRIFARLPLSEEIPGGKHCTCYNATGQVIACESIEDMFGCTVPEGYFVESGDAYANLRIIAPINDPNNPSPEEGTIENEIFFAAAPFDAASLNNFTMRTDNGLGSEVIIAQSFGNLKTIDALTYTFDAAELIIPVEAIKAAKENEEQLLTSANDFYFSIHRYTQKIKDGQTSFKKCFVAARDANDPDASLLPCYTDNTDFSIGETLKVFGSMKLVADPASLGFYWPTTDECICFTAAGRFVECAFFDE